MSNALTRLSTEAGAVVQYFQSQPLRAAVDFLWHMGEKRLKVIEEIEDSGTEMELMVQGRRVVFSGPELGARLRLSVLKQSASMLSSEWHRLGMILSEMKKRGDHRYLSNHADWDEYLNTMRPAQIDAQRAVPMIEWVDDVIPRLDLLQLNHEELLQRLPASAIERLVPNMRPGSDNPRAGRPPINKSRGDNRVVRALYYWIVGTKEHPEKPKTVRDVEALVANRAIVEGKQLMDLIEITGRDPVEYYVTQGPERMAALVDHILTADKNGSIDTETLDRILTDVPTLTTKTLLAYANKPHGRSDKTPDPVATFNPERDDIQEAEQIVDGAEFELMLDETSKGDYVELKTVVPVSLGTLKLLARQGHRFYMTYRGEQRRVTIEQYMESLRARAH